MRVFSDIIDFAESADGLKVRLMPAQRVLLKTMYGLVLDNREKAIRAGDWTKAGSEALTESEYLGHLIAEGRCSPDPERRVGGDAVLCIGRRAGKTLLISIILSYELWLLLSKRDPHSYYGMARNTTIQLLAVATSLDQAGLIAREVRSILDACELFAPYLGVATQSFLSFLTPSQLERGEDVPSVRIAFRSELSKGIRGHANYLVVLDEVAFFTHPQDVFHATHPSTRTFSRKDPNDHRKVVGPVEGRVIMISSPLDREDKFFQPMFNLGLCNGSNIRVLSFQAPSWEVNPTIPSSLFEREYEDRPTETFLCEFGGMFPSQHKNWEVGRKLRTVLKVHRISPAKISRIIQDMRD